jgi:hypothetical protein
MWKNIVESDTHTHTTHTHPTHTPHTHTPHTHTPHTHTHTPHTHPTHTHTHTHTHHTHHTHTHTHTHTHVGRDSSVGIATRYVPDGPGIESRWVRYFPPVQTAPGAHPASYTMGTGSFPGVKRPGLTTHPPTSRSEVEERVERYLYSTSGPSWPVLG